MLAGALRCPKFASGMVGFWSVLQSEYFLGLTQVLENPQEYN